MVLGFGWINNHCSLISGCGFIIDNVNYSDFIYSSLFDCISASTLNVNEKISPSTFYVYQNHPNPFNPITQINYQLSKNSYTKIEVYDMMGKLVKTLVDIFSTEARKSPKVFLPLNKSLMIIMDHLSPKTSSDLASGQFDLLFLIIKLYY